MTVRVAELVEHVRPTMLGSVVDDEHFAALPSLQVWTHPFVPSVEQKPY